MIKNRSRNEMRELRHRRLRRHLAGTAERPRLSVVGSLKHIFAQVIDDEKGVTLVSASTVQDKFDGLKGTGNQEAAKAVGKLIAERAIANGIKEVVFDRGGHVYHGRIKVLAEAAREAGLQF
ncbi:MAG: 50S ribosomal protein L18 [Synergistes sp.]|nr:50S ribosomal protein L18 [Synergistes sp.]